MSRWDSRIREHRVWSEMETLGKAIDTVAASLRESEAGSEPTLDIERLRAVLEYCGKRIAAADASITPPASLDSVASILTSVSNELTAFATDKQIAHIVNANVAMDGVLISVSQIPGAYSPEELGSLAASTADYRKAVSAFLSEAETRVGVLRDSADEAISNIGTKLDANSKAIETTLDALRGQVTTLTATIEAERVKLTNLLSDQQGQFSTAQDARSKEYTESLRLANEGVTKLVTDYQSQFSAAQDARAKEHSAAESARQTKYNETLADYGKKLADQDVEFTKQRNAFVAESQMELSQLTTEYEAKAADILADVEKKRTHVEKLVGVIGNLGVTSGYLRAANQARWAMWGWQAATLAALITLSTLAYKTLGVLEDRGGRFSWGGFAGRALLLVSLGVIAAYSGFQADKLFSDERRNRKLALELEAIGPYLAPLPVEDQNKFRVQIGERSFGREPEVHEHRKSPTSVLDLFKSKESKELLNLIIEAATKAKDIKP